MFTGQAPVRTLGSWFPRSLGFSLNENW
jgi:hypothetical protein